MRDVRVCVFGDSFVAGVGDPKALGWVGRVAARTPASTGADVTVYPLGVRGETIEQTAVRMPMEAAPRFAHGDDHRVVIAPGIADAHHGVEPARSVAALEFGLAALDVPTLVIGPPPVGDDAMLGRLHELDAALAQLCERRGVSYISTYQPLAQHKAWQDARAVDGLHPNQSGYGQLAYVVLNEGWYQWLDAEPPAEPVKKRNRS